MVGHHLVSHGLCDVVRGGWVCLQRVMLQPKLQHHEIPDQSIVVGRFLPNMLSLDHVNEFAPKQIARPQTVQAVMCEFAQSLIIARPLIEWHAKAMLLFLQDLLWEEISESLLEERAQSATLQMQLRWDGGT